MTKNSSEKMDDEDDLSLDSMEIHLEDSIETEPCILCRNPTEIASGRSFGIVGYTQPSSVLK